MRSRNAERDIILALIRTVKWTSASQGEIVMAPLFLDRRGTTGNNIVVTEMTNSKRWGLRNGEVIYWFRLSLYDESNHEVVLFTMIYDQGRRGV